MADSKLPPPKLRSPFDNAIVFESGKGNKNGMELGGSGSSVADSTSFGAPSKGSPFAPAKAGKNGR